MGSITYNGKTYVLSDDEVRDARKAALTMVTGTSSLLAINPDPAALAAGKAASVDFLLISPGVPITFAVTVRDDRDVEAERALP